MSVSVYSKQNDESSSSLGQFSLRCPVSSRELQLLARWLIRVDGADDMQIVHYSMTTEGLFVLLFSFVPQSFTSTLELGSCVWNSTFCAVTLYVLSFLSFSTSLVASPFLPCFNLFRTDSWGWFCIISGVCFFFFFQPQIYQQGAAGRARATVAPFPLSSSSRSHGPPPPKASRPALTLLGSGGGHDAGVRQWRWYLHGDTVRRPEGGSDDWEQTHTHFLPSGWF